MSSIIESGIQAIVENAKTNPYAAAVCLLVGAGALAYAALKCPKSTQTTQKVFQDVFVSLGGTSCTLIYKPGKNLDDFQYSEPIRIFKNLIQNLILKFEEQDCSFSKDAMLKIINSFPKLRTVDITVPRIYSKEWVTVKKPDHLTVNMHSPAAAVPAERKA